MIYDYEIKKQNGSEVLYLYLNFDSEFAKLNVKGKKKKLQEVVQDFISSKKIAFEGSTVLLVVGGLVVGTMLFQKPKTSIDNSLSVSPQYAISSIVDFPEEKENEFQIEEQVVENKLANVLSERKSSKKETQGKKDVVPKKESVTKAKNKDVNVTVQVQNQSKEDSSVKQEENQTYVTIYRSNGEILNLELEEYIIGVVASEMPASFHEEALKAQAVLVRTYAMQAINRGTKLTDTSSTQNYKSNHELKNMWGSSYATYYQKIKKCVESTKDLYLTYKGEIIDAVYHSTSNGVTEDAKNVWGNSVPYLVSVASPYDSINSSFIKEQFISYDDLTKKLGMEISVQTEIVTLNMTVGNRVGEIKIGDKTYTGVDLRNKLGLRSADFSLIKNNLGITFTTKGYGHGVGMSQYGANGMAKHGSSYQEILKHYYKGITIQK